jgi:hypothetical protein
MELIWIFIIIGAVVVLAIYRSYLSMRRGPEPKANLSGSEVNLPGPGAFAFDIVGESKYQAALEQICGGRTEDGHEKIVQAKIIHEDDNPYDNKAIRVDIYGATVGYFSREAARDYRKQLKDAGVPGATATCSAMIVGGWDRGGGDKGSFGVKLDLPTDD